MECESESLVSTRILSRFGKSRCLGVISSIRSMCTNECLSVISRSTMPKN